MDFNSGHLTYPLHLQVTVVRHFDNRWRSFRKYLLWDQHPVGEIEDYFWRVEFQRCASFFSSCKQLHNYEQILQRAQRI